jgi:hypothetical protein
MQEALLHIRERYKEGYVTQLSNGELIPWKSLSVKDYLYYQELIASNKYPAAIIENEIFSKCVLNQYLVDTIDKLPAGIVTTVVQGIMSLSAPNSIEGIEHSLNQHRIKVSGLIHDLVCIVCQAFPAYTPDELYTMPYELFIDRVALAERKLLSTGLLQNPLELIDAKEKPIQEKSRPKQTQPPKVNLAQKYKEQEVQTIITKNDMREQQELAYTGHEKADRIVRENELLDKTIPIYKDYMEQLQKDGKFTIKSPEARKAEAVERARMNEIKYKEMLAQKKKQEDEQNRLLDQQQKLQRTTRRKRR